MSFYTYDIAFLILFTLIVVLFLYRKRKNLKKEGIMYLYRTKVGIRFINYIGEKYKKTLSFIAFLSVVSGYVLMIGMIYLLFRIVYIYIFVPEVVRAVGIPPIMPLIPYIDRVVSTSFLPPFYFTYWIIAIAVIAIFHEFSHGIIARRYGIKIKTTGFGFLGPFLAAFVEPDEKQMQKKPKYQQIAVLSAGTFTNIVLAGVFFLLLSGFFVLAYAPSGAIFNSYIPGQVSINSIEKINNFKVLDKTDKGILDLIEEEKIKDSLNLGGKNYTEVISNNKSYFITINVLKTQLEQNRTQIALYYDMPAIRAGLAGTIISINKEKTNTQTELSNALKNYHPGDEIIITTRYNNVVKDYNIKLGANPINNTKPIIGVVYVSSQKTTILGSVYNFFNFFKQSATEYSPRYNTDFVVFVYNLIWWLALINLSVALMNMLPFTIFDGGRFFMLTIWGITKNKKAAELTFKIANWIIFGIILILMIGWAFAVF